MRSLFLTSAAFVLSTGIAFAQTATSSNTVPPAGAPRNMVPPAGAVPSASQSMGNTGSGANAAMYLHMAQGAVSKGNKSAALEDLSRAETRMLSRSVPASEAGQPINSPGVAAVRNARAAINAGNMSEASKDINTAMDQLHGNPTYNSGMGTVPSGGTSP